MDLVVIGLNHHTAPIEVRERLAFAPPHFASALRDLRRRDGLAEAAILSTCNRTEVYAVLHSPHAVAEIVAFLSANRSVARSLFEPCLFTHAGAHAVRHLMRVASGLDSLVLGEPQILGQVRESFAAAQQSGTAGPVLNTLFRSAISAGKRARTETGIGRGGFSIGHAAVDLARSIFGALQDTSILILGAGKMSELTAKHLTSNGVKLVLVANRTHEKAQAMAERFGGRAIRYDSFPEALITADVVVTSTASPVPIVTRETLAPALRARRGRPLFIIDIAVPRDVSHDVGELDNVFLYDLDDLQEVVADLARERASEAEKAEAIVAEASQRFMAWWRAQDAAPLVTQLKRRYDEIRRCEMERLRRQLPDLPDSAWERIEAAALSMMNRASRDPIERLKDAAAGDADSSLLEAAHRLFNLSNGAGSAPEEAEPLRAEEEAAS